MSKNGTSAIYKSTYYLGIVYVKLATKLHRTSVNRLKLQPYGTP